MACNLHSNYERSLVILTTKIMSDTYFTYFADEITIEEYEAVLAEAAELSYQDFQLFLDQQSIKH